MQCQDTNTTMSGCQLMVPVRFSLIQHNAAPSFHSVPDCWRASEFSSPYSLLSSSKNTKRLWQLLIHMPTPPALCLSCVQKQKPKRNITKGYQRAEIIIYVIAEFGWQPSSDPFSSEQYVCIKKRVHNLNRKTNKHRKECNQDNKRIQTSDWFHWTGSEKRGGGLKSRKEKWGDKMWER